MTQKEKREQKLCMHKMIVMQISGLNDSKGEERTETRPGSYEWLKEEGLNDSKGEERTETAYAWPSHDEEDVVSMTQKEKREQKLFEAVSVCADLPLSQ